MPRLNAGRSDRVYTAMWANEIGETGQECQRFNYPDTTDALTTWMATMLNEAGPDGVLTIRRVQGRTAYRKGNCLNDYYLVR